MRRRLSKAARGSTPSPIFTARLALAPLNPAVLAAVLTGNTERAAGLLGAMLSGPPSPGATGAVSIPPAWPSEAREYLSLRFAQWALDPNVGAYLDRAIIHLDTRVMVGVAGFHGPPDEQGWLEVAYRVFLGHRRAGFGGEAVAGLLEWASGLGWRKVRARIGGGNAASISLVRRLGFEVERRETDADGVDIVVYSRTGPTAGKP